MRCRDEGARLIGDGPLDIDTLDKLETFDLVIKECLRMVTPLPFNVRRAVRDTSILGHFIPAGTNINLWPGMNHMLPELWTTRRSSTRTASPSRAASTSGTATPSPRSAAARTSASAWCSANWRSSR